MSREDSVSQPKTAVSRLEVLALDLEGTLPSNAVSQIPRPGLHEFLEVRACAPPTPDRPAGYERQPAERGHREATYCSARGAWCVGVVSAAMADNCRRRCTPD